MTYCFISISLSRGLDVVDWAVRIGVYGNCVGLLEWPLKAVMFQTEVVDDHLVRRGFESSILSLVELRQVNQDSLAVVVEL